MPLGSSALFKKIFFSTSSLPYFPTLFYCDDRIAFKRKSCKGVCGFVDASTKLRLLKNPMAHTEKNVDLKEGCGLVTLKKVCSKYRDTQPNKSISNNSMKLISYESKSSHRGEAESGLATEMTSGPTSNHVRVRESAKVSISDISTGSQLPAHILKHTSRCQRGLCVCTQLHNEDFYFPDNRANECLLLECNKSPDCSLQQIVG